MTYSIYELKLGNEARIRLLLQDSVPAFWPSLFILEKLRARTINTQQGFLSDLLAFFAWLKIMGIDLESRLEQRPSSQYLKESELMNFVVHANWTKKTLDKRASGVALHPSAYKQVGAAHVESRIISVKKYLAYLYENLGDTKSNLNEIQCMEKRLDLSIRESRPSWRRKPSKPKGLNQTQVTTVLSKLHYDSEENPWPKFEAIRVRNFLIALLLFELGIRRGEMLGIKLVDIDWQTNRMQIIRRHNDPDDPRKTQPLVKTQERLLPVPEHLMAMIQLYKQEFRSSKQSKKHPYLLVAHGRAEGAPLSVKAVDQLFVAARKAFPELEGVTPHSFRHHDVYRTIKAISKQTKGQSIEDRMERERRLLTAKFGWSDTSEMPDLYGQKYYQEEADKALLARNIKLIKGGLPLDEEEGE